MKTLLVVFTLIFISFNSFADPSSSAANYTAKYANEDGTYVIVGPKFGDPRHTNMPISATTNLDVVCHKFGFTSYVPNSLEVVNSTSTMVELDNYEHFQQYVDSGPAIERLFCLMDQQAPVVNGQGVGQKIENDDGTFWITDLTVHYNDQDMRVSGYTDPDVVCRRYGFSTYVKNSAGYAGLTKRFERSVRLSNDNEFLKYDGYDDSNPDTYNVYYSELICNP